MQTIDDQGIRKFQQLPEDPEAAAGVVKKAVADPRNMVVRVYTPGTVIKHSDRSYTVQEDGSWRRNR